MELVFVVFTSMSDKTPEMKIMNFRLNGSLALFGLILWLLASSVILQGCMDQGNGEESKDEAETALAIPVEAATVSSSDMSARYTGTATLEADEQAVVVSQITGVVLKLNAEEADFVETGQVLVTVETDRYALEVERANASIKAPISGFISERMVRVGNLVKLHQPVFHITSYDPLLAVLHVPERELRVLSKGLPVSMSVDAWPGESFLGEVIRISPVVDTKTGTFRVTAQITDHGEMLKPGLFGRAEILYDLHEDVPVIPRSAVITEDDQSHVFVINEDGSASRRAIQLGFEDSGLIEVLDGLSKGETVVTAGKGSLSDGTRVEIVARDLAPQT